MKTRLQRMSKRSFIIPMVSGVGARRAAASAIRNRRSSISIWAADHCVLS
jgi:hypothetical protein